MTSEAAPDVVSYAEYLAVEGRTGLRHEWIDGVVVAMAGGTPTHNRLCAQIIMELGRLVGDGPCGVYTSDQKIRARGERFASYPDAAVVCGEVETHDDDRTAIVNPVLLVEVLSEATEPWDRAGKFRRYRRLDSLRDYVLVSQHERCIEVYSRGPDGVWLLREAGEGGRVPLTALTGALEVDRVYRAIELAPAPGGRPA